MVQVQALARNIMLCSWARHFTLTVPLSTPVYKWVRAEIPFRSLEIFSARGAIQPRVKIIIKILARFDQSGLGFSAGLNCIPGLNPSPCNRQFDFKRICFISRAEIRHVIRPLVRGAASGNENGFHTSSIQ